MKKEVKHVFEKTFPEYMPFRVYKSKTIMKTEKIGYFKFEVNKNCDYCILLGLSSDGLQLFRLWIIPSNIIESEQIAIFLNPKSESHKKYEQYRKNHKQYKAITMMVSTGVLI